MLFKWSVSVGDLFTAASTLVAIGYACAKAAKRQWSLEETVRQGFSANAHVHEETRHELAVQRDTLVEHTARLAALDERTDNLITLCGGRQ